MLRSLLVVSLFIGSFACTVDAERGEGRDLGTPVATVPPRGTAETFDIGEWNLEWFGSTTNGPGDEQLQLANARDVILGTDLDLWGVEEIVSAAQFDALLAQLPGYDGFLANDPFVVDGSAYYSPNEQKVGIIFKTNAVTVQSARLVATADQFSFGGRPPLEVTLRASLNRRSIDFVFLVLHAKALTDQASYDRRVAGSIALKAYLDASRPVERVVLVGDVNDDLDTSIHAGSPSPYQNFLDDPARYAFPTKLLTDTNQSTTVSHAQPIDHHLISNEMAPYYVASSASVYRVDEHVPAYGETTSDHLPTYTRYAIGITPPPPPPPAQLLINEILANEPGTATAAEFVEIVNAGATSANLGGYTLSDAAAVRHVFAAGTTLAPGKALVVYGAASGIPAGVTAVPSSTGTLSLNNPGDTVRLASAGGATIDSFTYDASLTGVDAVSMNRSPDASATGTFVLHTSLSSAPASPGKRATGGAF